MEVLEVSLDILQTLLERSLDVVDVGGETGQRVLEAVAALPALDVKLLSLLGYLLLGLRREGIHQLLQDAELLAARENKIIFLQPESS